MTTPTRSRRKFLNEDILVERLVREDGTERLLKIKQIIPAACIIRIAESIEFNQASVVWVEGDNYPMTVDCPLDNFYAAWCKARANHFKNQLA